MSVVSQIHALAAIVPPHAATAVVLLFAAVGTLAVGLIRHGRSFLLHAPGLAFIATGALLLWPLSNPHIPTFVRWTVAVCAAAAIGLHLARLGRASDTPADVQTEETRSAFGWVAVAFVLASVLLFHQLGTYHGVLVAWEATVVEGFAEAVSKGETLATYTRNRFLWDDGVLSAGHTSLFYGAPTYALFQVVGFSPFTLRVAAAVATLLCIVVIHGIGRRFFGTTVAGALAVLFALNPVVLFYGRYGSSPAGTLLATLLALLCTWMFLQRKRPAWWMAGLCAVTLFTATLQYSPGRLVVLILLGLLVVVPLWQWRRMTWQRGVGLLLIFIAAYGVWQFETSQRRQHYFLHARGEQFFSLLENPATVETLLGKKLDRVPGRNAAETWRGQLALLNQFMQTTVPQYVSRMSPNLSAPMGGGIVDIDPPPLPLYYAPLAIFIVLGLVYSMRQLGTFTHFCLLAWVGGITLPLLMTNRVDVHRIMLFLVPLSIWAALGIREAVNILHAASIPRLARQVLGAVLLATLVYSDIHLLHRSADEIPQPFAAPLLAAEIDSISDPVVLGWDWDNREVGWLHLKMLERMRRDPQWRGERLAPGLRYAARADGGHPTPHAVHGLQTLAATHTILLAPAERFKEIAAVLQQRGVRVARRGNERFRFFRLDAGATATGVPDEEMRPLPTIVILPTPTPVTLQSGPHIPLSGLEALDVSFEFAEPRMNRTWQGGPIRMGGHVYPQGIGMHAWTRMTYAVPPEAKALQAVIGLSDGIKECTKASVTFEVEDQDGNRLYDSGLVDVSAPPIPIRVDLRGATTITLVVSDAGNGIDCDHANWALPGFLLDPS